MENNTSAGISYLTLEETLELGTQSKGLSIGIPRESTFQECRVPLTPGNVSALVNQGQDIVIESGAGKGAGFADIDYSEAGAKITQEKAEVFAAHIILKAAPVSQQEIDFLKPNQIVISPIHVSAMKKEVLEALLQKKIIGLAFELIKDDVGDYPIVRSMSEIAGNASILTAARLLADSEEGSGVLLGGVTGIPPAKAVIIGAGVVGEFAARTAIGLGAEVKIFDNSTYRLMRIQNHLGVRCFTSALDQKDLETALRSTDVLITALKPINGLIPMVISEEMVMMMKNGSVLMDVNIDRGGACATSEVTSHENPTFVKHGIIHYCVPNIPSSVPRTASIAISHVLMPLIADASSMGGVENYIWSNPNSQDSVYLYKGYLTNAHLSKKFKLKNTDINIFRPFRES